MGRTRVKSKKSRPVDAPGTAAESQEPPPLSALLEKAQSLVTQCNYDLAQKFVERILDRLPQHVEAKELLGVIQLERGDTDDAKITFQSLLKPKGGAPENTPPSAHLYLAQLSDDDPRLALEHYQAAVNIMLNQLKGKEPASGSESHKEDEADIKRNIVRVLIAMVEIWMAPTYDLCFDPKAEETCEALLNDAFAVDAHNVEALICLSSVRLSQQRPDEARDNAMKAWHAWKDLEHDDPLVPPIPTRIELAKRFIELSEFSVALLVIQTIMAADDQDVEAWYLEGWCFFLMAEQAKESGERVEDLTWEELAQDAQDCLDNCRMLHLNQAHPDQELLGHVTELISQLHALGITQSPQDGGNDEDEDEWVDSSDDDRVEDVEMA